MKCIYCGADSKYKDRTGGYCSSCKRKFAFEPKSGDAFTDMAFQSAIKAVSADGRMKWGVEHLYYEINRRKLRKRLTPGCLVGVAFLLGVALGLMFVWKSKAVIAGLAAFILMIILIVGIARRLRAIVPIELVDFNHLWKRWVDTHGKPVGVIERLPQPPPPTDLEADIGDYSFDRAVICDRARTVDLLLANNFHFENNCAVLSIEGYPPGPFAMVRKMLKRNPKLVVIVVHDATPKGCRVAHQLRADPEWFPAGIPIVDVGLRPCHASPFKGLFLEAAGHLVDPIEGLSPAEARWLTRYQLELAVIRPEQILKRLFAALNRHANDEDGTVAQDDVIFSSSGGGDSGEAGVDGFG